MSEPSIHVPSDEDVLDLCDLNYDHWLEIGPKSEPFCSFGVAPLLAFGETGHDHLVLVARPDAPRSEWVVALYSEEEGDTIEVSATPGAWLPGFLLFAREGREQAGEGEAFRKEVKEVKKALVNELKPLLGDRAGPFVKGLSGKETTAELYELAEPGSCLARHYALLAGEPDDAAWEELILGYPQLGLPLVARATAEAPLPPRLAWELFRRPMRPFGSTYLDVLEQAAQVIEGEAQGSDAPTAQLVELAAAGDVDAGAWSAAARKLAAAGDHVGALAAYENAIYALAIDEEAWDTAAFAALQELAKQHAHADYQALVALSAGGA